MLVQGAQAPRRPFLGAVCTLQRNQSEAEGPRWGALTDLAFLGLRMLRGCPGSVLPGPPGALQTRALGGKEASPPPSAVHSEGPEQVLRGQQRPPAPAAEELQAKPAQPQRGAPSEELRKP